jgi:hypothetical protein
LEVPEEDLEEVLEVLEILEEDLEVLKHLEIMEVSETRHACPLMRLWPRSFEPAVQHTRQLVPRCNVC